MKRIAYTKASLKALRRMPANTAKLIVAKIDQYASDPASLANKVTKLQGRDGIRLRVGEFRVIMTDAGEVLDVIDIGPRGGIYD